MPYFISSGNNYRILNVSLTDVYQDISIPRQANSFVIQMRNDSKVLWRRSSTDTANEWTFKTGEPYSIDGSMGYEVDTAIVIGQAKCADAGATDTLEIWYWFI